MYPELIILILFFLYYQAVKFLTYWKRNGVPQDSIGKILKNNFGMAFQKLTHVQLLHNYCKSFPNHRYIGVYQAFQKCLIIQDPELLKQITVKDFDHFVDHSAFGNVYEPLWDRNVFALQGNEWKNMRAALNAAYTSSKMKIMFNVIQERCLNFVNHFQKQTENQLSSGVDVGDAYTRFAIDVMATSVFGYKCDSIENPTNDFYVSTQLIFPKFNTIEIIRRYLRITAPKVASFLGARMYTKFGTNYITNLTAANMQERKKTQTAFSDMIQVLMEVNKKNGTMKLENIDIAAQAAVFFFAGIETFKSTLCFASYELASHMNIQRRLQMEVDEIIEHYGGTIPYSAVQDMKYMNMVISESLRKWPPIVVDRKCTKPYVIQPKMNGEVPVYLNKGDIILLPIHEIHRNPKTYPNPDQFDPERFNDENKANVNPYSYFPFGVGPRICVAKRFALIEIKLMLFHILSKFDIVCVDKTVDPNEFGNSTGLVILIFDYWLALRPRTNVT